MVSSGRWVIWIIIENRVCCIVIEFCLENSLCERLKNEQHVSESIVALIWFSNFSMDYPSYTPLWNIWISIASTLARRKMLRKTRHLGSRRCFTWNALWPRTSTRFQSSTFTKFGVIAVSTKGLVEFLSYIFFLYWYYPEKAGADRRHFFNFFKLVPPILDPRNGLQFLISCLFYSIQFFESTIMWLFNMIS